MLMSEYFEEYLLELVHVFPQEVAGNAQKQH